MHKKHMYIIVVVMAFEKLSAADLLQQIKLACLAREEPQGI